MKAGDLILYERGVPSDVFTLILQGKALICTGEGALIHSQPVTAFLHALYFKSPGNKLFNCAFHLIICLETQKQCGYLAGAEGFELELGLW